MLSKVDREFLTALKLWMKENNVSRTSLARALKVNYQTVSRWMELRSAPTSRCTLLLAKMVARGPLSVRPPRDSRTGTKAGTEKGARP